MDLFSKYLINSYPKGKKKKKRVIPQTNPNDTGLKPGTALHTQLVNKKTSKEGSVASELQWLLDLLPQTHIRYHLLKRGGGEGVMKRRTRKE